MSDLKIPESWAEAKLECIFVLNPRNGDVTDTTEVTFVRMAAVDAQSASIVSPEVRNWKDVKKGFTHFMENDVIFAKITPCMENKKSALAVALKNGIGAGSTEFHVFRPSSGIVPKFALQFLRSDSFVRDAEANMTGSAGQKRVPTRWLSEQLFPIPATKEQQRIVAKIESCFEKIDATRKSLDKVEALLEKYRESILAKVFRGELISQDPRSEPASKLIGRIRNVRGKQNSRNKRGNGELSFIAEDDFPFEIPRAWEWIRLGEISDVVRGGSPRPAGDKKYYDGDIPFLRVADLTREPTINVTSHAYSIKPAGLKKTRLVPKDTLMLTNSGATLGVPRIVRFETTFNDGVAAFLGLSDEVSKEYLCYYLDTLTKSFLSDAYGSHSQGQPNLNTDIIAKTLVPIPPSNEQLKIVSFIEKQVSQISAQFSKLQKIREHVTTLRSSILTSAFSGRLVPQILGEGTGHELLKQILGSRTAKVKEEQKVARKSKDAVKGKKSD